MSRLSQAPSVSPLLTAASAPQPAAVTTPPVRAEVDAAGQLHDGLRPFQPPEPAVERKQKVGGWNGYPSNLARIRAAWFHTQTAEDGWPSLSEMTEQLLLREAERLEAAHNSGRPFPPMPPGKVRHSRRSSS